MPTEQQSIALLLIAHGSRRPEANADLVTLATQVRERSDFAAIEVAYLELTEPTIPQGIAACVQPGIENVRLLPYFLSAGVHVIEDLEQHRQDAEKKYPHVTFELCPPLGLHPKIIDVVLDRSEESLASRET
ncbi:sirohydrochlorin chelatase [Thalassoroseus pseudoceratinae]|uniref:sirohydrochlorin chelatase n=1 Tax=Thalassoroseus pseudoceratinae TaxID=2713176 RepID=UPI001421119A|nr:CbiX/SirB N-terminal domain-containing protein [Thalassoroseus pseudoceratinae]